MIPPCRDTENRQTLVDISYETGDRAQHRPFALTGSNSKLQRHRALVMRYERHVHVGRRPGIAERVLYRRNDADHPDWLSVRRFLGVEELNQPAKCVLSWPQFLRERIVHDRHTLRRPGGQFGIAEITADKHGKSEGRRVVAAHNAEDGVHG